MTDLEDRFAACLARALPGFRKLVSQKRLSGGASQETYRLELDTEAGARTVAARRAAGGVEGGSLGQGPGLAIEAQLFRLAREAGVPEPEVLHVFEPEEGLGPGFLMEWLEGETVGSRVLRAPELALVRPHLARQCGEILARIHALDVAGAGLAPHLETVSAEEFVHEVWERYRGFDTALPMIDYTARWLLDHLPKDIEPRLVHNDFRNGNLMISPDGIVAVLDWELAHLGDPVRDLGWICTNSWRFGRHELPVGGFGELEDLLDGYESVSGTRIDPDHVRFWGSVRFVLVGGDESDDGGRLAGGCRSHRRATGGGASQLGVPGRLRQSDHPWARRARRARRARQLRRHAGRRRAVDQRPGTSCEKTCEAAWTAATRSWRSWHRTPWTRCCASSSSGPRTFAVSSSA